MSGTVSDPVAVVLVLQLDAADLILIVNVLIPCH